MSVPFGEVALPEDGTTLAVVVKVVSLGFEVFLSGSAKDVAAIVEDSVALDKDTTVELDSSLVGAVEKPLIELNSFPFATAEDVDTDSVPEIEVLGLPAAAVNESVPKVAAAGVIVEFCKEKEELVLVKPKLCCPRLPGASCAWALRSNSTQRHIVLKIMVAEQYGARNSSNSSDKPVLQPSIYLALHAGKLFLKDFIPCRIGFQKSSSYARITPNGTESRARLCQDFLPGDPAVRRPSRY